MSERSFSISLVSASADKCPDLTRHTVLAAQNPGPTHLESYVSGLAFLLHLLPSESLEADHLLVLLSRLQLDGNVVILSAKTVVSKN